MVQVSPHALHRAGHAVTSHRARRICSCHDGRVGGCLALRLQDIHTVHQVCVVGSQGVQHRCAVAWAEDGGCSQASLTLLSRLLVHHRVVCRV